MWQPLTVAPLIITEHITNHTPTLKILKIMSYQIIKNLRTENGEIKCQMASNNVRPRYYYEWARVDNEDTREMVRRFIRDFEWQPQRANAFIRSLNISEYFDGTPTPWTQHRATT